MLTLITRLDLYTQAQQQLIANAERRLSTLNEDDAEQYVTEMLIAKGICISLVHLCDYKVNADNFPELYACKPENVTTRGYWWERNTEGFLIRLTVLDWCIEEVKFQMEELEEWKQSQTTEQQLNHVEEN